MSTLLTSIIIIIRGSYSRVCRPMSTYYAVADIVVADDGCTLARLMVSVSQVREGADYTFL